MAAYLGQEGWTLELEMREGGQHGQKGTPELLQRVLARAQSLTQRHYVAAAHDFCISHLGDRLTI